MSGVTAIAWLCLASARAQDAEEPVPDESVDEEMPLEEIPVELLNEQNEARLEDLDPPTEPTSTCIRSLGAATGVTPGGRDWDFTTPGAAAWTLSPVLSQGCMRVGDAPHAMAFWLGLDVMPWYQHSYRRLADRAPLWLTTSLGLGVRVAPRQVFGAQIVTNAVAFGGGLRWTWAFTPEAEGLVGGLDLRLDVLGGVRPDVRSMVLLRFHSIEGGDDSERLPAHPVGWKRRRDTWDLRAGFESGSLIGLRGEVGNDDGWGLGARLGIVTAWRRDIALQPLGVGYALVPVLGGRVSVAGGSTRYDGDWIPVTGVAWVLGSYDSVARLNLGVLLDPRLDEEGFVAPDLTFALMW